MQHILKELVHGALNAILHYHVLHKMNWILTMPKHFVLAENGVFAVCEGANMPTTPDAIHYLMNNGVFYAPGKASNAGGVACSGLEMSQNAQHLSWTAEEVDEKLEGIMVNIFNTCRDTAKEYGHEKEDIWSEQISPAS